MRSLGSRSRGLGSGLWGGGWQPGVRGWGLGLGPGERFQVSGPGVWGSWAKDLASTQAPTSLLHSLIESDWWVGGSGPRIPLWVSNGYAASHSSQKNDDAQDVSVHDCTDLAMKWWRPWVREGPNPKFDSIGWAVAGKQHMSGLCQHSPIATSVGQTTK